MPATGRPAADDSAAFARAGATELRFARRNIVGVSDPTVEVEGAPCVMPPAVTLPPGATIPLGDHDRQSLIVRLAGQDCRIRVWWSPSDDNGDGTRGGWWASLEVPTNTPVVTGRRLALNAGLLDRIEGILAGNLVMRDLGGVGVEPGRDAFARARTRLRWEHRPNRPSWAICHAVSDTIDIKLNAYAKPYMRSGEVQVPAVAEGIGKSARVRRPCSHADGGLPCRLQARPGAYRERARIQGQHPTMSVKRIVEEYIGKFGIAPTSSTSAATGSTTSRHESSHLWFPAFGKDPNAFRSTFKVDVLWIEEAQFLQPYDMEVIAPSIFRDEDEDDPDDGIYERRHRNLVLLEPDPAHGLGVAAVRQDRRAPTDCTLTTSRGATTPGSRAGSCEEREAMLVDDPEAASRTSTAASHDDGDGSEGVDATSRSTLRRSFVARVEAMGCRRFLVTRRDISYAWPGAC